MPPELVVKSDSIDGVGVVTIAGELDLTGAPDVARALAKVRSAGDPRVLLDLSACSFVDSTGLATILHGTQALAQRRQEVQIICPDGNVRDLLRLTAIDQTLAVYESRETALSTA
jgi:anti-sigma B factor antagonist